MTENLEAHIRQRLQLAAQLGAQGKKSDMIAVLREMLSLQAGGQFWGNVAHLLYQAGDLDNAEVAARNFCTTCPDIPQAKSLLAGILGDMGKVTEAIDLAEEAAAKLPENPTAYYSLGVNLSRANRMGEAAANFEKVLALEPAHPYALEYLAQIDGARKLEQRLAAIDDALAGMSGPDTADQEAALHYARASLLERQGRRDDAYRDWEAGARRMDASVKTDLDAMERYIDRLKRSFDAKFFEDRAGLRHQNERCIYIVGMPRSGTSLVESILGAHSNVLTGGEASQTGQATMSYRSFEPQDLQQIDRKVASGVNPWAEMGRELAELQVARFGSGRRITDKNLGQHFFLGVIAMISAGAPIIHCTRDPVATAWSCFKTRFQRGNDWSYNFESIARYQRMYTDLLEHWGAVLPDGSILTIGYEDLVSEPEKAIRQILAHAGLEFEEACLQPHKADRPVLTASMAQVRQPIYKDSLSGWKVYEKHLQPYLENLRNA